MALGRWATGKVPSTKWTKQYQLVLITLVRLILSVTKPIDTRFGVLDTAQAYRNESEAGTAIRESGLKREEIYVTTKYSGLEGLDVQTSIRNSLKNVSSAVATIVMLTFGIGIVAGFIVR